MKQSKDPIGDLILLIGIGLLIYGLIQLWPIWQEGSHVFSNVY